jgi:hypothetical protein
MNAGGSGIACFSRWNGRCFGLAAKREVFMECIKRFVVGGSFVAMVTLPTLAMAQTSGPLPPPRSYDQPPPPAPVPGTPSEPVTPAITKEAGIGGTQAYGRAGVLELGGSGGLSRASSFTSVSIAPSIGWFVMNNIEISGIVGVNYVHTDNADNTIVSVLAEPSYHLPFTEYLYGFLGLGAGMNYANAGMGGAGFALVPRIGANIVVGRSGILTPAAVLTYSTSEAVSANGTTGDHTSLGVNVGYTVMW